MSDAMMFPELRRRALRVEVTIGVSREEAEAVRARTGWLRAVHVVAERQGPGGVVLWSLAMEVDEVSEVVAFIGRVQEVRHAVR